MSDSGRVNIFIDLELADAVLKLRSLRAELQTLKAEEADIMRRQGPWAGGIFIDRQTAAINSQIQSLDSYRAGLEAIARTNAAFATRPETLSELRKEVDLLEYSNRVRERSLQLIHDQATAGAIRVGEQATGRAAFGAGAAGIGNVAAGAEAIRVNEAAREAHARLNQNLIQDSAQYYAQETALRLSFEAEQAASAARVIQIGQQASAAKQAFYAADVQAAAASLAQEATLQARYESEKAAGIAQEIQLGQQAASMKAAFYERERNAAATMRAQMAANTAIMHESAASIRNASTSFEAAQRNLRGVGNAASYSTALFTIFVREFRHVIAILDEGMRGQRSMQFSSVGAMIRDAMSVSSQATRHGGGAIGGAGTVAGTAGATAGAAVAGTVVAIAGITALAAAAVLATLAISRVVRHMGELAETLQNNAAATGMSVEQFSLLQRTMQLASGDANKAVVTFGRLATSVESAMANPMSRAASAFLQLGISQQQLREGLQDLPGFLEVLRQKFEQMPASMQRTMLFRDALGVGFQHIISILRLTSEEFAKFSGEARNSFAVLDEHGAKQLEQAATRAYRFQEALSGLGIQIGLFATNLTGPIDKLTQLVNLLSRATEGWRYYFAAEGEDKLHITADRLKREGQFFTEPPAGVTPTVYPTEAEKKASQETEARVAPLRAATPGVTTTQLTSPVPEISSMKRELDENVRLIRDQASLREAELNRDAKAAGSNAAQVNALEQQKIAVAASAVQREQALRQAYYDRIAALAIAANDQIQLAEARRLLDSARIEKQSVDIQTQAIEQAHRFRRLDYENFVRDEENKVREARGDWAQIGAIIEEWRQRAAATYDKNSEDFKKSMEEIRRAEIAAQEQRFRSIEENLGSQNRLSELRLRINEAQLKGEVAAHNLSKTQEAQAEASLSATAFAEMEARTQAALASDGLNFAQKQKLYEQLSELYLKDADAQATAQAKATAAIEAENKRRVQSLTQMFDSIGSTLENAIIGALTGKPMKVQDFYRAIFTDIAKSALSLGSQLLGKALAPELGVKVSEGETTSIGAVLGRALGNALGLTKDAPQSNQAAISERLSKASEAAARAAEMSGRAATSQDGASVKFSAATDKFVTAVDKFGNTVTRRAETTPGKDFGAAGEYGVGQTSAVPSKAAYSVADMRQMALNAGFRDEAADKMAAVAMAESRGNPAAHRIGPTDDSYGLTQINALAHGARAREAINPQRSFDLAYEISKSGTDLSPWSTFNSGAYRQYMPSAAPAGIIDRTAQAGFGSRFGELEGGHASAMVIHHTGGGASVDDVINTFKQRNFPAHFVIDRQGQTFETLPDTAQGQHIRPGEGRGAGLSNANTLGVEVIAKNDADVLAIQREAARRLVYMESQKQGFPLSQVFGHGEINAHKQETEGVTIAREIRGTAGSGSSKPLAAEDLSAGGLGTKTADALTQQMRAEVDASRNLEQSIQRSSTEARTTAEAIKSAGNSSATDATKTEEAISRNTSSVDKESASTDKLATTNERLGQSIQSTADAASRPSSGTSGQISTGTGGDSSSSGGDTFGKLLSAGSGIAGLAGIASSLSGQRQSPLMRALTGGLGAISSISGLFSKGGLFGSQGLLGGLFGGGGSTAALSATGAISADVAATGGLYGAAAAGGGGLFSSIFSAIGSLLPFVFLEKGGIVSAAGGTVVESSLDPHIRSGIVAMARGGHLAPFMANRMVGGGPQVNDGKGGRLIIAHPGEMVVPAVETGAILSSLRSSAGGDIISANGGAIVNNVPLLSPPRFSPPGVGLDRMTTASNDNTTNFNETHNYGPTNISAVDAHSVDRLILQRYQAVNKAVAYGRRQNSSYAPR